ncbi:GPR1/FUN34/yaaH family domain-containing protein [Trichoderma austrokoningii]
MSNQGQKCEYEERERPQSVSSNEPDLERLRTKGGHIDNRDQPSLPIVHRSFANPAPLGLLSFATGVFLLSMLGVHARGIVEKNIMVGVFIFFGGICQFIAGIMEFVAGNTFGATVFPSYAALSLSFALIFIPGSGIIDAYSDAEGHILPEFNQAIALYLWSWFILNSIFTVASVRSSWTLFMALLLFGVELILLATGYMTDSASLLTAGNSVGFLVSFCAYWSGCAGLWSGGITPFTLPTFPMYKYA